MPNKIVALVCAVATPLCPHPGKSKTDAKIAADRLPAASKSAARNVILFIGEGMGVSTVTAAHALANETAPKPVDPKAPTPPVALAFETFPATALAKTDTVDLRTGESAGAMTAVMTGIKTRGAAIGVDADQDPAVCKLGKPPKPIAGATTAAVPAPLAGQAPTLLEQAKDAGLSAGLVTTVRVTQSVPAATYAHAANRDWEDDSQTPPGGCRDIARQMVEFDHHGALDVVLGGGRQAFLPATVPDPDGRPAGVRQDGNNLVDAWLLRFKGRYVSNKRQFDTVDWKTERPVLGLFAPDRMTFMDDIATQQQPGGEPTLTDMTRAAITALKRNRRGYVLVVDAGGIAAAHRSGNAHRALTETLEFSHAVQAAQALTSARDTLIVVTADQGSPLTIAGYPKRSDPILGLAPGRDLLGNPYTILGYANGPGRPPIESAPQDGAPRDAAPPAPMPIRQDQVDGRPLLQEAVQDRPRALLTEPVATATDYVQVAAVPLEATTHSGEDVPIYALGPGSQAVRGVMDQSGLYWVLRAALPPVAKTATAEEKASAKAARPVKALKLAKGRAA